MKVAWFTPLSTRSAVGEFSLHVTTALAEHCTVDLWVSDHDVHRQTELRTFLFGDDPALLHRLAQYDLAIYNLGNNDAFHGTIYDASRLRPGIVVLHDRSYQHLFAEHWVLAGDAGQYHERMEVLYGEEGARRAADDLGGARPVWESDADALRYPLVEEVLDRALGAVVHSADHAHEIRRRWFGPVGELFLPAYPNGDDARPGERDDGRVLLLTLGRVNRNKQVHRVLEILADDPELAGRVEYVIVGPGLDGSYGREVAAFAREHGLDQVSFLGYQPDGVVDQLLAEADICINLRYPPLESGSASLIRQLEVGKAVLGFDVGAFAEIPAAAMAKVPPGDGEALERVLRQLVDDPSLRAALGATAAGYAATLTPQRYAEELLDLADYTASWEPVVRTVDLIADELTLLGAGRALPALTRIGHEVGVLVSGMRDVTSSQPLLRALGPGDRDVLARFLERNDVPEVTVHFHPFPMTSSSAEEIVLRAGDDWYFGAFIDGRLVGLSMLRGWNEGFDVPSFGIVVDHGSFGQGIGSLLTDFTLDRAPWLGSERVRLSVYASNERARRMYLSRGFEEIEREPVTHNGSADERILMLKELKQ
ncbi:MAG TPA: GNAT family N-acetyltransferase [Gaiellaceae bacterium]|nr:GNAT family N-acetyltransferase [Gaiellaceae bacterium]